MRDATLRGDPTQGAAVLLDATPGGTPHAYQANMRTHVSRAIRQPSEPAPGRELVVEGTTSTATNGLHRAYRTLLAIGVEVLETRLRMEDGDAVQTLHLAELDDAPLAPRRVLEVLAALNSPPEVPSVVGYPIFRERVAEASVAP